MRFGISTHLYHDERLTRDHLLEIAAHGFEAVEVFATRTHFDYHDGRAIEDLAGWIADAGLALHSIHAPIVESLRQGRWGPVISNAAADPARRAHAVRETDAALNIAKRIPTQFLVVHLGTPTVQKPGPSDNHADSARRSLEEIHALAEPLGVRVAVEVIPNPISDVDALVGLIEDDLELPNLCLCLDFGHAVLMGDPVEAVESASGHLMTTHVHDNAGVSDDHLAPYDGTIDWASALTAMQKIGYDGAYVMELANLSTPREVLEKARRARERFERILQAP